MKGYSNAFAGVALLVLAGWLSLQSGGMLLTLICIWIGLLMVLSVRFASPGFSRLLQFGRIGLAFDVVAYLALVLLNIQIVQRDWLGNPEAIRAMTWLQWLATPVTAGFDSLVNNHNWGIILFPEYGNLCSLLTAFGNCLVHIGLGILVLMPFASRPLFAPRHG